MAGPVQNGMSQYRLADHSSGVGEGGHVGSDTILDHEKGSEHHSLVGGGRDGGGGATAKWNKGDTLTSTVWRAPLPLAEKPGTKHIVHTVAQPFQQVLIITRLADEMCTGNRNRTERSE